MPPSCRTAVCCSAIAIAVICSALSDVLFFGGYHRETEPRRQATAVAEQWRDALRAIAGWGAGGDGVKGAGDSPAAAAAPGGQDASASSQPPPPRGRSRAPVPTRRPRPSRATPAVPPAPPQPSSGDPHAAEPAPPGAVAAAASATAAVPPAEGDGGFVSPHALKGVSDGGSRNDGAPTPAPTDPARTPDEEHDRETQRRRNAASPFYDLSYTKGMPECYPKCYLPDLGWKSQVGPDGRRRDQFGTYLDWQGTLKTWGKRTYPARVACMLGAGAHQRREMESIATTWGRHCDGLYFAFSAAELSIAEKSRGGDRGTGADPKGRWKWLPLPMRRPDEKPGKKRTNYWEKMWRMWLKASMDLLDKYDWFYKGDTDTFCSVPNLRRFAQFYDPDEAFHLGHTHLARWGGENGFFNAGAGYVLSRGALRRLGHVLRHIRTTQLPQTHPSHCVDRPGAGEDITFSFCLRAAGIIPTNTLDRRLRQRFLVFQWKDHYREMPHPDTRGKRVMGDYYWQGKPRKVGHLTECCAPEPIAFHNYKAVDKAEFMSLERRFTANGSKPAEVPTRPQCFLYDESIAPQHDKHRNTRHPPRGQTIYTRPGELECLEPDWSEFEPTR